MLEATIAYPPALTADLTAILSACILPLVSAYLACISRDSFEERPAEHPAGLQCKVMASLLAFALGFASVNIFLGASPSLPGGWVIRQHPIIRIVGGLIIIMFGLSISGFICIRCLGITKRLPVLKQNGAQPGTVPVEMAFAAGWCPFWRANAGRPDPDGQQRDRLKPRLNEV